MGEECGLRTLALVKYLCEEQGGCLVELETNLREVCSFTITEKAPTWAFSWLKASTRAFAHKI